MFEGVEIDNARNSEFNSNEIEASDIGTIVETVIAPPLTIMKFTLQ